MQGGQMKKIASIALTLAMSVALVACNKPAQPTTTEPAQTTEQAQTTATTLETTAESTATTSAPAVAPAPDEEGADGFDEFPLGDPQDVFPLHVGGVYFQPVDMEPAGKSLPKSEADAHLEADISALANNGLGYGEGDFVPYLRVKAFLQKEGSDNVQEVAFMPMNAGDGPHYGANVHFNDGLGTYHVRFEIQAPGSEYLLHVDKETGVPGRFWTEPINVEWEFDWTGPKW